MHRRCSVLWCGLLVLAAACSGAPSFQDGSSPDAGVPDGGGGGPDGPGPDTENADRLFDLTQLHTFDLEVAPADWEWLKQNARLEQWRPATLVFEGRRYEGVAVRFKGGYNTLETCFDENGAQICPKLSIKLKFNEYVQGGRFKGLRRLNFNSSVRDETLMHEVVSYYLFRSMGVPAPRASHALVNVNGEPQGLFVMVEDVDKEFLQVHYPDDAGNLYKSVWPQYTEAAPYVAALQTNETTADVTGMISLAQTAQQATDMTFVSDVASRLDLGALAKFLAVDRAIFSDDGVEVFYCYGPNGTDCANANYYWYEVPGGPTQLIPWDLDYTLGDVNTDLGRSHWDTSAEACAPVAYCDYWPDPSCVPAEHEEQILRPQCNQLFGLVHRATWSDYRLALRELADGPLSRAQIVPLVTSLRNKLRPAVAADTHGPGIAAWEEGMDWLEEVLDGQLTEIETLLAEPSP